MDLSEVRAALKEEIAYGLMVVSAQGAIGELGEAYETLSEQLEGLAICYLLEDADRGMFRENLIRSGHARRHFLRRARLEGETASPHLGLSRSRAFLDVMVAGHLALAREIAELSPDRWSPSAEYEDDFCFYLFLQSIARRHDPFPTPEQMAILDRFERALEGGESPRLAALRALAARDAEAFAGALGELLSEEKDQIEEDRDSAAVLEGDLLFWPNSFVSMEALGLLKIADVLRLPVPGKFPRCPPMARLPWTNQAGMDFFEEIERG